MNEDIHTYDGETIEVRYDVNRCIHARECVKGLPAVFDPNERPWIDPDAADADDVAAVITQCPTGALHFERKDGGDAEVPPPENTIDVVTDGPHYVHGDVEIADVEGTVLLEDTRVALCRCGASSNKPLCDDSHREVDFEAPGAVDRESDAEGPADGELSVTATPNGPLHVEGSFVAGGEDGPTTYRSDEAWLCRCGASSDKPFCDGSHANVGFSDDE